MAAGWLVTRPSASRPALATQAAIFGLLGTAPDLDLLIGRHSDETHSLGAAILVAGLAAWWRWPIASRRSTIFIAAFIAWASHPVLDACGADMTAPFGVMALWPFSTEHFYSPWSVFAPISRRWYLSGFWQHNVLAVAREVVILAPLAGLIFWLRRDRRRSPDRSFDPVSRV
jgi:inner membrane protein